MTSLYPPYRSPLVIIDYIRDIIRGKTVCELGCACGDILIEMQKYAQKVIGIENRPDYIQVCRDKGLSIIEGDLFTIPLPVADIYYGWFSKDKTTKVVELIKQTGKILILLSDSYFYKVDDKIDEYANLLDIVQNYKTTSIIVDYDEGEGYRERGNLGMAIIDFSFKNEYVEPNLSSYYQRGKIGKTIYDIVKQCKPKKVIEFGTLYGYSSVCIAEALRDIGEGQITSYDLHHIDTKPIISEATRLRCAQYIMYRQGDFYQWLTTIKNPQTTFVHTIIDNTSIDFDMLHFDIDNNGEVLQKVTPYLNWYIRQGIPIIFEGGSIERDRFKSHEPPFSSVPIYDILNPDFPSISIINKEKYEKYINSRNG